MKKLIIGLLLIIPVISLAQDNLVSKAAADSMVLSYLNQVDDSPVSVPTPSEQAIQYDHSGNLIWIGETLWGFLLPIIFLFTGLSVFLRKFAERISRKKFIVILIYAAAFFSIDVLINLPIDYFTEFVRPHSYGLSDQTFGKWIGDSMKSLMLVIIFGGLLINLLYLVLRKSPKRWWLYFGLLNIPITFIALIISPVFIAPLFNDFGPMKNKELENKILALAGKAGIDGGVVYEVNKSVDTKTINAYVSGFGSTKRIVLWDNTIKKMDENELLFVMGHEMGHYVLGHVVRTVMFLSLFTIVMLFLAWKTSDWFLRKYGSRIGVSELSDIASFPLILFVLAIYGFIFSPATNTFSRHLEHEADIFGLEITKNNHSAATAFVKLQEENLANPRPNEVIRFFRSDHPTLGERIDFCNIYKPWKTGEKMRFDSYFKEE